VAEPQDGGGEPHRGWMPAFMTLRPESTFQLTVQGRWLACLKPGGQFQSISLDDVYAVYFRSAPGAFGIDWWIVESATSDTRFEFPLGATGEADALEWLKQLPGFEIGGMNSTESARVLCWSRAMFKDRARD